MTAPLRIGTRGSRLARWQTDRIIRLLADAAPKVRCEVVPISTTGDRVSDKPLDRIGARGIFTKELEHALLDRRIDAAVHSMKDLESVLPEGLKIGAVPEREDVRDALAAKRGAVLEDLPDGAVILTGSLRRRAQLAAMGKGFRIENVRGNVETRLRTFRKGTADALIIAAAGIKRLGLADAISGYIPVETLLPAVGQGALAVEIRADDGPVRELCEKINDQTLMCITAAERAYMRALQGGCSVPIGAYGRVENGTLVLSGLIADLNGDTVVRKEIAGSPEEAEILGKKLANAVLRAGGELILRKFRAVNQVCRT